MEGGGHRALEGGQFRFWSNVKVLCILEAYFGHFCVFLCVKSAFFQITKLFRGKCAHNQTLVMIALEYCNLALISSQEQKNKQYLM